MNSETTSSAPSSTPRGVGRPSRYSLELAQRICSLMATQFKSLRWICLQPDMPSRTTVYTWLNEIPEFRRLYQIAREEQLELLAEQMIEIADNASHDWIKDENGKMVPNRQAIARSKLQIAVRQWLITHLIPNKSRSQTRQQPQPMVRKQLTPEEFEQRMKEAYA